MKIIIANWKMNPNTFEGARALFDQTLQLVAKRKDVLTIVCPPFPYLQDCSVVLSLKDIPNVVLGAQDMFWEDEGPFTGEVSPAMLRDLHIDYVLIGHSDRRYIMGETDEMINKKIVSALRHSIIPILLVGEREHGDIQEDILVDQLSRDLAGVSKADLAKIFIAYEPAWAISTNKGAQADNAENILNAIQIIKTILNKLYGTIDEASLPIMLYGGSVNPDTIRGFLVSADVKGAVVGGVSLKPEVLDTMLGRIAHDEVY